ncbi:MAG: tetratricopeptide repeat protein, partial [Candidatus Obscuribacterales bacterium]|nr:tetratricopeptide repeat protein [Candidatus Obscuribacterales bacterium]
DLKLGNAADFYEARSGSKQKMGDYTGALSDLDKAVSLRPKDMFLLKKRAEVREHLGDIDGAIADLTLGSEMPGAWANLERARLYCLSGQFEKAIADFDQCLLASSPDSRVYLRRALLHEKLGDLKAAAADYRSYLAFPKHDFSQSHLLRAFAYKRLDNEANYAREIAATGKSGYKEQKIETEIFSKPHAIEVSW